MKASAHAPSNLAFIKYWGRKDEELRLPINGSVSMCLDNLITSTTIEFQGALDTDDVTINGEKREKEVAKVSKHLDRIRRLAGIETKARVVSNNNFNTGTGLSSSASGFAALTVAGAAAAGLELSEKDLSILARQGSGSACRSIPDGFVEWHDGDTSDASFAESFEAADHWDIADVVAVTSGGQRKKTSSTDGQKTVRTSRLLDARLAHVAQDILDVKRFIRERKFQEFGELIQAEALSLHAIMMTQRPHVRQLRGSSLFLMDIIDTWQEEGLQAYYTVNTGQDVHIMCQGEDIEQVTRRLGEIDFVSDVIVNRPGKGARTTDEHLF